MTVDFVPRSHLADHFRKGWRLIPGYDYARKDWAILLMQTDAGEPTGAEMRRLMATFAIVTRSNKSQGSLSRISVLRLREAA